MKNLSQFVADTQFLPPAFQLLPRLLELLEDPEANSEEIAEIIRLDPGLTANVLRVCNSARYAGAYRVETLQEAVMRLGLREVYRVVAGIVSSPVIAQAKEALDPSLGDIWNHALACASAGHILAGEKGDDPEIAFTAGLLHDIGKVLIMHAGAAEYTDLLKEAGEKGLSPLELEKARFRMNHAEVGALLLKRWNFPPSITAAVQFHHKPSAAKEHARIAAYTQLADSLARRIGHPYGPPEPEAPDAASLELLDLTEPELLSLQYQVLHSYEKEKATFS